MATHALGIVWLLTAGNNESKGAQKAKKRNISSNK